MQRSQRKTCACEFHDAVYLSLHTFHYKRASLWQDHCIQYTLQYSSTMLARMIAPQCFYLQLPQSLILLNKFLKEALAVDLRLNMINVHQFYLPFERYGYFGQRNVGGGEHSALNKTLSVECRSDLVTD